MENDERGLIKLLVLIIIAVLVLSYFGFDLRGFLNSDTVKGNFGFLLEGAKTIWREYLTVPSNFIWGIFYNYIWLAFIENMDRIRQGRGAIQPDYIPTIGNSAAN